MSHNMFAYVSNNPATMKDPSGYAATKAIFIPIVAIGAFAVVSLIVIHNAVNSFVDQAVKNYNNWKTINKLNKSNSEGALSNGNEVVDSAKPRSTDNTRLKGKSGEVIESYNKKGEKTETLIGDDGLAIRERHYTDRPNPKYHTNPHDHLINWTPDGNPEFSDPINYPKVEYPYGPPKLK